MGDCVKGVRKIVQAALVRSQFGFDMVIDGSREVCFKMIDHSVGDCNKRHWGRFLLLLVGDEGIVQLINLALEKVNLCGKVGGGEGRYCGSLGCGNACQAGYCRRLGSLGESSIGRGPFLPQLVGAAGRGCGGGIRSWLGPKGDVIGVIFLEGCRGLVDCGGEIVERCCPGWRSGWRQM